MLKTYQQTINHQINFKGTGLHSGKNSNVKILPGVEDQGIVFKRVDLKKNNLVSANYKNVTSSKLCTTLENEFNVKVSTVEHLLAALYIAEIDSAIIEIDNEEVPIMDGSAKDFLDVLQKTEIRKLKKKRKYLKVLEKVELIDGDRKISIEPSGQFFEVEFQLNYKNKLIGKQKNKVNFLNDNLEETYISRTFCLFEDIEKIKKIGLAKGGSLDNAIVVDQDKILNSGGLRNKKEFVNHKILDLAGDFVLSGYRILGKVNCHQGGHQLSNSFLKTLFKSKTAFIDIEMNDFEIEKKSNQYQFTKLAVNA